jgi:hypothetical protein
LALRAAGRPVDAAARSVRPAAVATWTITTISAAAIAAACRRSGRELRQIALNFRAERTGGGASRAADARAESARHTADDSTGHVFVARSGPPDPRWADESIAAAAAIAARTIPCAASAGDRSAAGDSRAGSRSGCAGCAALRDGTAGTNAVATRAAGTAIPIAAGHCGRRCDFAASD